MDRHGPKALEDTTEGRRGFEPAIGRTLQVRAFRETGHVDCFEISPVWRASW